VHVKIQLKKPKARTGQAMIKIPVEIFSGNTSARLRQVTRSVAGVSLGPVSYRKKIFWGKIVLIR